MAERMAISAVSPSRISPTATISGSWRSTARKPSAKVMPLICTWLTPSMLYSTGSSSVTRLTASVLSSRIIVYMVELLPDPVGPTIRTMPLLALMSVRYFSRSPPAKPIPSASRSFSSLSSRRITTVSPWMVGSVDMRRSMSCFLMRTFARPSWGMRRSEVFIVPMIFKRAITLCCSSFGTVRMVRMMPSMRMRTCMSASRGSR